MEFEQVSRDAISNILWGHICRIAVRDTSVLVPAQALRHFLPSEMVLELANHGICRGMVDPKLITRCLRGNNVESSLRPPLRLLESVLNFREGIRCGDEPRPTVIWLDRPRVFTEFDAASAEESLVLAKDSAQSESRPANNDHSQSLNVPPRLPGYLLRVVLPSKDFDLIDRELEEQFVDVLKESDRKAASRFYYTRVAANILYYSLGAIKRLPRIAGLNKLGILKKISQFLGLN